jgi:exonuclease I
MWELSTLYTILILSLFLLTESVYVINKHKSQWVICKIVKKTFENTCNRRWNIYFRSFFEALFLGKYNENWTRCELVEQVTTFYALRRTGSDWVVSDGATGIGKEISLVCGQIPHNETLCSGRSLIAFLEAAQCTRTRQFLEKPTRRA